MGPGGGSITDLRSLLPPVCLLTAALPLALVPRNCNPASPGLLLLVRRASGGSSGPCRVHTSGCTSVPLDPAALLPALRCHVKWRQGSQVRQRRGAGCLLFVRLSPYLALHSRGALKRQNRALHHLDLHEKKLHQTSHGVSRKADRAITGYFNVFLAMCFHSWGCMNGAS